MELSSLIFPLWMNGILSSVISNNEMGWSHLRGCLANIPSWDEHAASLQAAALEVKGLSCCQLVCCFSLLNCLSHFKKSPLLSNNGDRSSLKQEATPNLKSPVQKTHSIYSTNRADATLSVSVWYQVARYYLPLLRAHLSFVRAKQEPVGIKGLCNALPIVDDQTLLPERLLGS